MKHGARRRRDPEARRREIVTAAAELIVEVGAEAVTHRMVAARAGVPLGATTQYFDTLDDLRAAAFRALAEEVDARLDGVRQTLAERGVSPHTIATLIADSMEDAHAVQADRAVVTAAVHDPRLRELARHLSDRLVELLEPTYGEDRARAAMIFIDGVMWNMQIRDDRLAQSFIETALARILGDSVSTPTATTATP
ncbi:MULTISPECIES: TetR/AcrR family transcriptional regulator [Microbacterium]|uniref:TetR/AcrR family transcriptional regulator n=1 Tax=Microbacterium TaxID=33882 RepID=UPI001E4CA817|nr:MULTISPECIES: TetR family transcriptional regulator [Microbacterium]MCE0509139.1 TetR family transcriptional regulator [Microbacterium sp. KKR3/1]MCK8467253.1 TetR family transcriptional regulator [Microbacterium aurugineum]MCK8476246.1 TetR family transcriptional regulator [Microbacterium aurugineum]